MEDRTMRGDQPKPGEPERALLKIAPFDAYDFFGYLTPGLTLFLNVLIYEMALRVHAHQTTFGHAGRFTAAAWKFVHDLSDVHWSLVTAGFALLLLTSYVVGHVVASVSSLYLERALVVRGYGYPYENLLGLSRRRFQHDRVLGYTHKGAFFWLNCALLAGYLNVARGSDVWHTVLLTSGLCLGTTITVGSLLYGGLKSGLIYGAARRLWGTRRRTCLRRCVTAFGIVALPYELMALPLSRYLNTRSALTPALVHRYRTAFKRTFSLPASVASTNNFWFANFFVSQHGGSLALRLTRWFHLYSYARNLSAAFGLSFVYAIPRLLYWGQAPVFPLSAVAFWVPITYVGIAAVLLVRYYYLYAGYYSKFVFRAFVYLAQESGLLSDAELRKSLGPLAAALAPQTEFDHAETM